MYVFNPPPGPRTNYIHPEMICPIDDNPKGDHSYDLNVVFAPYPGDGRDYRHKFIRLGNKVKYFTPAEVVLMVDKFPEAPEWHLDVSWDDYPTCTRFSQFSANQWDWLVFYVRSPSDKPKYKHGKNGNNYLFLDMHVANTEPADPRPGHHTYRGLPGMVAPHTYTKE